MIKLSLDEEYLQNKKIDDIFTDLSNKIISYAESKGINLIANYCNDKINLMEKQNLKKFLMSDDFYEYDLVLTEKDKFINDFIGLDSRINISSLINMENTSSKGLKTFNKKYTGDENLEKIKEYIQKNKLNGKLSNENKKKIIENVFSGYIYNDAKECFNYEYLKAQDRHLLISMMGVKVCPYCNMNYIVKYNENGENKTTGDLDHFYSQTKHKEYSLCLFNFIPSCPVCNSRFKLCKEFNRKTHIYPYEDSFENKASFNIENIVNVIIDNKKIQLGISNPDKDKKIDNNIKDLKIEKIYQEQTDYVYELLNKVLQYNDTYIEELGRFDFLKSEERLKHLIFGKQLLEEEMLSESLGKLRNDLLKQLGVYS